MMSFAKFPCALFSIVLTSFIKEFNSQKVGSVYLTTWSIFVYPAQCVLHNKFLKDQLLEWVRRKENLEIKFFGMEGYSFRGVIYSIILFALLFVKYFMEHQ